MSLHTQLMPSHATTPSRSGRSITIGMASDEDREQIYRLRYEVYARELGQHAASDRQTMLRDAIDEYNAYVVVKEGDEILGFASFTPPGRRADGSPRPFSIDKYLDRSELPVVLDEWTYEVRLLAVLKERRGLRVSVALMYAILRVIEELGGRCLIGMGRAEVVPLYERFGMRTLGIPVQSGKVRYEVVTATMESAWQAMRAQWEYVEGVLSAYEWKFEMPRGRSSGRGTTSHEKKGQGACEHGGGSFGAIGAGFDDLERWARVINADVGDAWFSPSPKVVEALQRHTWMLRTCPPTHSEGMVQAIAAHRRLPPSSILVGAGTSPLTYLALREWLTPRSRALVLAPSYGEYAHVMENQIGCRVDRFYLRREDDYAVDTRALLEQIEAVGYDLVVLVNPNSPTGKHIPRRELEDFLARAPRSCRFLIDEAYGEFVGEDESVEQLASRSENVVVCKSLSKVYALSGLRAGYLAGPPALLDPLRPMIPPWAVSLPAQVAVVRAMEDTAYYRRRWEQTRALRREMSEALARLPGFEVIAGEANYILVHLDEAEGAPSASELVRECKEHGLFLRNASQMGGQHGDRLIRIVLRDKPCNDRMIEILREVLSARQEIHQAAA